MDPTSFQNTLIIHYNRGFQLLKSEQFARFAEIPEAAWPRNEL